MLLRLRSPLLAGGPGSGCHGDNCGRPPGPGDGESAKHQQVPALLKNYGWKKSGMTILRGQPAAVFQHPVYGELKVSRNWFEHYRNGIRQDTNIRIKSDPLRVQLRGYLKRVQQSKVPGAGQPDPKLEVVQPPHPQPQLPPATPASGPHTMTPYALSNAPIVRKRPLGGGVSQTQKVTFADGSHAVFKSHTGEPKHLLRNNISLGMQTQREVGAWEVAKIVGLDDLVAPTVERTIGNESGSLQAWQDGKVAGQEYGQDKIYDGMKDLARAAAFDYMIGNEDRHGGNWMIGKDDKLRLIDHGLSFPDKGDYYQANDSFLREMRIREKEYYYLYNKKDTPPPSEIGKQFQLKQPQIEQAMRGLGFPDRAIVGVRVRISNLADADKWDELR